MSGDAIVRRRWRLLDAVLLIAATAVAALPAKDRWTELFPVARQLELTRVIDPAYVKGLFHARMRSGRSDSVREQFAHMVGPVMGPWGFIAWEKGHFDALEQWVWIHASRGALGFALAQDVYYFVFPFLVLWSFCFVILRLMRPRPAWFDLFRQPGWWACFGSTLAAVLGMTLEDRFGISVPSVIVPAFVFGAWAVLAVSQMWKAERSSIDRMGRLLGVLWLGTIPIYLVGFVWNN